MKVNMRTIWVNSNDNKIIQVIDQRFLPHKLVFEDLKTVDDFCKCIKEMHIRGAGLIGATAGYGMYIAVIEASKASDFNLSLLNAAEKLKATRPTAVNLAWAIERQLKAISQVGSIDEKINIAFNTAGEIADEDASFCKKIGKNGAKLIEEISKAKNGETVNILTHCNAGWLAFVDYGSATAPIYEAFNRGIKIHVWVDETRPRNQGARLTAWELGQHGVPHTIISDNVGGHIMQHGKVDMCIVGTDRTTYTGDVANKIGTYLKALAANDNNVPFYVALPSSSFDWKITDGVKEIPIEERGENEVKYIQGLHEGEIKKVLLCPSQSKATNFGFDVTPARLVTGLITERGICKANKEAILTMFPENDEGYVKFNSEWIEKDNLDLETVEKLNEWRSKLYSLGLIGMYDNGIGFGNISERFGNDFIISGTATGGHPKLDQHHYTIVKEMHIEKNSLTCEGPIKASSESMSHGILYEDDSSINGVIHVHNLELWDKLYDKVPTTNPQVQYGTPEMTAEISRLYKDTSAAQDKIIVMGGHKEGILTFGKDLDEAGEVLMKYYKEL
jgi:methylthioribose-1-phosphate isomerase